MITTDYDSIDKKSYILARNIWKLNSKFIITTNYDSVLEKAYESDNVQALYLDNNFKLSQVVSDEQTKPMVLNIHGHEFNVIKDILDLYAGHGRNHYLIIKEDKVISNLSENIKIITYKEHSDLPKLIEELIPHNSVEISEKKQIRDIDRYWTIKPSVNTEFIGRKEDLDKIDVMLQKSNVTLIVMELVVLEKVRL